MVKPFSQMIGGSNTHSQGIWVSHLKFNRKVTGPQKERFVFQPSFLQGRDVKLRGTVYFGNFKEVFGVSKMFYINTAHLTLEKMIQFNTNIRMYIYIYYIYTASKRNIINLESLIRWPGLGCFGNLV